MQTKNSAHINKLVKMAILVAVMLLFNYTPLGFLKIGAIEITFMCIPIAIGAIMLGPTAGAVLGGIFGVLSFAQCFGASPFGVFLLSLNPVLTGIVCIVPRVLCGWLTGLLFRWVQKVDKSKVVSYFAASLSTAVLNTLFFMVSIILFFWKDSGFLSQMNAWELPTDSIWVFFLAFVGVNGLVEAAVTFVVGGAVAKALARYVVRSEAVDYVPETLPAEPTVSAEAEAPVQTTEEKANEEAKTMTEEIITAQTEETEEEFAPTEVQMGGRTFTVAYRKSFLAKLMGAKEETKAYYAALANELSAYVGVKGRTSWDYDSYGKGREQLAKLAVRGKTLCLYLALPYEAFAETKYNVEQVESKKYAKVPTMLRVRSERGLKWAKELIADLMARNEIAKEEAKTAWTAADFPCATLEEMLTRGLVKYIVTAADGAEAPELAPEEVAKLLHTQAHTVAEAHSLERQQVSASDAHDLIDDTVATELLEVEEGAPVRGKSGRKFAVNVDTLSRCYNDGEVVDIASLKAKKLVPAREQAVKILARGMLDKALYVHADSFSPDAVKMIVLTGGKAILTHKK